MHIGVLTGGGDCPGLNAVIRAVTLALRHEAGAKVTGIRRGFRGLLTRSSSELNEADVGDILAEGGTILGTDNTCDPFRVQVGGQGVQDQSAVALGYAQELGLDAIVAIGGDGTMTIAHRFVQAGLPMVGVPKTIDNDIEHTERTFGFDSAVAVVAESLDRLRTTARSHGRVMIAETMGRYAGWIALEGGLAGGADVILLPEIPFSIDAVAACCRAREAAGLSTLICVAEGARAAGQGLTVRSTLASSPDPLRLGGVAAALQQQLQPLVMNAPRAGLAQPAPRGGSSKVAEPHLLESEVRSMALGHLQRGGSPTAFDRVLATRFGYHAAALVQQRQWGQMVALQADRCVAVPMADVAGKNRLVPVDHPLLSAARALGLSLGQ